MQIVGCDLHTRYQQIARLETKTGEFTERRLEHANGEARVFYAELRARVRVGIEATGHTLWLSACWTVRGPVPAPPDSKSSSDRSVIVDTYNPHIGSFLPTLGSSIN